MTYIFTRNIVTDKNISYIKGQEVPADFPKESLERLLESGHVSSVESPTDFLSKITKKGKKGDPEVEALDPDAQPRSK